MVSKYITITYMKLDCIVTSVNNNPLYSDFIPLFIKTWNKLYPHVDVKIIYIHTHIPENIKNNIKNLLSIFKLFLCHHLSPNFFD